MGKAPQNLIPAMIEYFRKTPAVRGHRLPLRWRLAYKPTSHAKQDPPMPPTPGA